MISEKIKPEYREIEVAYSMITSEVRVTLWANVLGSVAYHRSLGGKYWVVTHVASGRQVGRSRSKAQADWLARLSGDLLSGELDDRGVPKIDPDAKRELEAIFKSWTEEQE